MLKHESRPARLSGLRLFSALFPVVHNSLLPGRLAPPSCVNFPRHDVPSPYSQRPLISPAGGAHKPFPASQSHTLYPQAPQLRPPRRLLGHMVACSFNVARRCTPADLAPVPPSRLALVSPRLARHARCATASLGLYAWAPAGLQVATVGGVGGVGGLWVVWVAWVAPRGAVFTSRPPRGSLG